MLWETSGRLCEVMCVLWWVVGMFGATVWVLTELMWVGREVIWVLRQVMWLLRKPLLVLW